MRDFSPGKSRLRLPCTRRVCSRARRSPRRSRRCRCPRVSGSPPSSPFPAGSTWSTRRTASTPDTWNCCLRRTCCTCDCSRRSLRNTSREAAARPGLGKVSRDPRARACSRSGGFCGRATERPVRCICLLPETIGSDGSASRNRLRRRPRTHQFEYQFFLVELPQLVPRSSLRPPGEMRGEAGRLVPGSGLALDGRADREEGRSAVDSVHDRLQQTPSLELVGGDLADGRRRAGVAPGRSARVRHRVLRVQECGRGRVARAEAGRRRRMRDQPSVDDLPRRFPARESVRFENRCLGGGALPANFAVSQRARASTRKMFLPAENVHAPQ